MYTHTHIHTHLTLKQIIDDLVQKYVKKIWKIMKLFEKY